MAPATSLVTKLKVQLKLAISRLRMTQQKDTALAKQQRRHMAQLCEEKKLESARIRVENIIRSDITTELHEILELYCELLLARAPLLDTSSAGFGMKGLTSSKIPEPEIPMDDGLEEAVRSIIYAAPRTNIKELNTARSLLIEKFGKDYAISAMEGEGVAERVLKKLKVDAPSKELVDQYLRLICETYSVHFPGDPVVTSDDEEEEEDDDDEGDGGAKVPPLEAPLEAEDLAKATPPRDLGVSSPIRVAPPSPSTENVSNKLKLPDKSSAPKPKAKKSTEGAKKAPKKAAEEDKADGGLPDMGDLAARFAALKKL